MNLELKQIAVIKTEFPNKFGIPRQSGLAKTEGYIIFEKEYRSPDALRGLEDYTHLWIIWGFSENFERNWSPTVRPPRLGGNKRMGVFATRSPFRPNPVGLSLVKIRRIVTDTEDAPIIVVEGADLMNDTPIYDLKPYLPYIEAVPDAKGGFSDSVKMQALKVVDVEGAADLLEEQKKKVLFEILSQDPRPHYQNSPERIYGMCFSGYEVKFRVEGDTLYLVSVQQAGE